MFLPSTVEEEEEEEEGSPPSAQLSGGKQLCGNEEWRAKVANYSPSRIRWQALFQERRLSAFSGARRPSAGQEAIIK